MEDLHFLVANVTYSIIRVKRFDFFSAHFWQKGDILLSFLIKQSLQKKSLFVSSRDKTASSGTEQTSFCHFGVRSSFKNEAAKKKAAIIISGGVYIQFYYSTIMSFYHIRSREQAKYEAVIHCSVLVKPVYNRANTGGWRRSNYG